jgi:peptidoglycan/LPS O-acetylase OafA/YrhL
MDQFLLGIFVARHALSRWGTASAVAILLIGYGLFTASGGFYESPHRWAWILLPTLEAVGFAALVAWYDHRPLKGRVMGWVAAAGDASYGIYLLHGLLVTAVARAVDSWLELDSIYEAFPFVLLFFVYMALLGRVTFQFIEQPFLRHRRSYFRDVEQTPHRPAALLAKEPFKAPPRPLVLP